MGAGASSRIAAGVHDSSAADLAAVVRGLDVKASMKLALALEASRKKFEKLRTGGGCTIDGAQHRAITVEQLRRVREYILEHCVPEAWRDTRSPHKELQPEVVNLYHLLGLLIKPCTEETRKSYVEFVAAGPQDPKWFVSHWWGESVMSFVVCLEEHAKTRRLHQKSPYWVCAYGNSQWAAAEDVGVVPLESAFMLGMMLADGVVHVLDPGAVCYSRVWCDFEVWVSLVQMRQAPYSRKEFLYDMCTCIRDGKAAVITEGYSESDMFQADPCRSPGFWKYDREKAFPLSMGAHAMTLRLERAEASQDIDRCRILNTILGKSALELDEGMPLPKDMPTHPEFDAINQLLRGRFAIALYRPAMEAGEDLALYESTLRETTAREFRISFNNSDMLNSSILGNLLCNLPHSTLILLDLDLDVCYEGDQSFVDVVASVLPQLTSVTALKLSFRELRKVTHVDGLSASIAKLVSLTMLILRFGGTGVTSVDCFGIAFPNLVSLRTLELDFEMCSGVMSVDGLGAGLEQLVGLRTFKLSLYRCAGILGIDGFSVALMKLTGLTTLILNLGFLRIQSIDCLSVGLPKLGSLSTLELCLENSIYLSDFEGAGAALATAIGSLTALRKVDIITPLRDDGLWTDQVKAAIAGHDLQYFSCS